MLEDQDSVPDADEQKRYRALIRQELGELKASRAERKQTEELRMLMEEMQYFEEDSKRAET